MVFFGPRRTELAGYGFGLPLTRLHAQYFGGDVFMQALPGGLPRWFLVGFLSGQKSPKAVV